MTPLLSTIDARRETGPGDSLRAQLESTRGPQDFSNTDPLQRIGGSLALHCCVNLATRKVVDVASVITRSRGYETLLPGKNLGQAGLIGSTASGICGGVHAATSAQCLEMALGIQPPPLAIVARNLLLSCQYLNDNAMHLFLQCGPDYSEAVVKVTNPEIWAAAQGTAALHRDIHGYDTIGAIMTALNRGRGRLYSEALDMMRTARAAYALLGGKYPYSESICPGGVAFALGHATLDAVLETLEPFVDYSKRCARIWDDIFDFLYDCAPGFRELGRAPANMLDFGAWDHEDHYDARFATCDRWGEQRWSTPGAVLDGALVTTKLSRLNNGFEDFAETTVDDAGRGGGGADPAGGPLPARHPWSKIAARNPADDARARPYSWATSLTWDRHVFEVGAYTRLYISALAKKIPANAFVESTGRSLVFHVPAGKLQAERLEWKVPEIWNAFERNRARAYAPAFNLMVTLECTRRARILLARGQHEHQTAYEIPLAKTRRGVGFGGAGRGLLAHWVVLSGAVISNYQIAVPSRINGAPRTPWGELGPCERALRNTPIIESGLTDPAKFHGIDLVRVAQSFDPCMPCKMHVIFEGTDFASTVEVNTDGVI